MGKSIFDQYAHTSLAASAKAMCLLAKASPPGTKIVLISKDNRIIGASTGIATIDAFAGASCIGKSLKESDVLANATLTEGAYRVLAGKKGTRGFRSLGSVTVPNRTAEVTNVAKIEGCAISLNPDLAKAECLTLPANISLPDLNNEAHLEAGRPLSRLQQTSAYLAWATQTSSPECTIALVNNGKLVGYSYEKDCARAAKQAVSIAKQNHNLLGGSVAWMRDINLDALQTLAESVVAVAICPCVSKSSSLSEVARERRIKLYLI